MRFLLGLAAISTFACATADPLGAPDDAGFADGAATDDSGGPDDALVGDAEPLDVLPVDAGIDDASVLACPTIGAPTALGVVAIPGLAELSGLAVGRASPDVLWAHNDSSVELYAIDRLTLGLRGHYRLVSAGGAPIGSGDVEDIAILARAGGADIYLGDIGSGHQGLSLHVYRVEEPLVPSASVDADLVAEVMNVSPLRVGESEALLVDPWDGSLVLMQKDNHPSACALGVFQAGMVVSPTCGSPVDAVPDPSAGDVSSDGKYVALRNESIAGVWLRAPGMTLTEALRGVPCAFSSLATPTNSDECNGEALAFSPDGQGLYTASERGLCPQADLHRYGITP